MNKEFQPFQRIIVKQGEWVGAFFSHERSDGFLITTGGGVYTRNNVLPYEGNQYLLGTSKDVPELKVIKGSSEKGEVVISMLEHMGGSNSARGLLGTDETSYYYINDHKEIEKCSIDSPYFNKYNLDLMELPKRWRAKRGMVYWYINQHMWPQSYIEDGCVFDNNLYSIGNYFRTAKEANVVAAKLKKYSYGHST